MRSPCVLVVCALLAACGGGRPAVTESAASRDLDTRDAPGDHGIDGPRPRESGTGISRHPRRWRRHRRHDQPGRSARAGELLRHGAGTGETALDKPCEAGQRFQAEPKVAAFLRGPTQACAERVEFMLYSTQATLQFIKRGDDASGAATCWSRSLTTAPRRIACNSRSPRRRVSCACCRRWRPAARSESRSLWRAPAAANNHG